jgi:AraC-like DNA-binding protein
MAFVPPERHLLRAKDLVDSRYPEPLSVDDLAAAARLSRAHFSREFKRTFGESPHHYLRSRRLERAEPQQVPYGIDSAFRDPSGNSLRLAELSGESGG